MLCQKEMDEMKRRIENLVHVGYLPCTDSALLDIFNEEVHNMGLEGARIQLLIPTTEHHDWWTLVNCSGSKKTHYDITVFPNNIEKSKSNYRSSIRYGLAHIKHGDLDRHLLRGINWLYRHFIAEPRARSYE